MEQRVLMTACPTSSEEPTPPVTPAIDVPARASEFRAEVSGRTINFSWRDNSTNEAGFNVFRLNLSTRTLDLVGHVDADMTSFTENSAPIGSFRYAVRAVNANGKGEISNIVCVNVREPEIVTAPRQLMSKAESTTSIALKFEGARFAKSYIIERSADGVEGWTPIGTTSCKNNKFMDTGLTAGTRYYYRITAVGRDGTMATSATLIGQTKMSDRKECRKSEKADKSEIKEREKAEKSEKKNDCKKAEKSDKAEKSEMEKAEKAQKAECEKAEKSEKSKKREKSEKLEKAK